MKAESLSEEGPFSFKFDRASKDGAFIITILDSDDSMYAEVYSDDFKNALRHALHYADPLLAAWAFEDQFNWSFAHQMVIDNE